MNKKVLPSDAANITQYLLAYVPKLSSGIFHGCMRCLVLAPFPFIFKAMVDVCIPSSDFWGIIQLSVITMGLLLLHYVFSVHSANLIGAAVADMNMELRSRIFYKIQYLSFGYLDQQKTGRLLSKYAFDTQKIEGMAMWIFNQLIPNLFYSAAVLTLLLFMNWQLALILVTILPIYGCCKLFFFKRIQDRSKEARVAQESLTGTANEYITALRLVRSLGEEKQAREQVDETSVRLAESRVEMVNIYSMFGTFTYISTQFLTLTVIAGGALLVINDDLQVGDLFAFMASLPILMSPVQLFIQFSEQYFIGQEAYRSMKELLDCAYIEDWNGKMKLPDLRGEITFEKVTFTYPSAKQPIFSDFQMKIEAGEKVAIVGPSGSGKSTIANLVLGLYKPDAGSVMIDGYSQQSLDMRWFRRQTALVMQESVLLSGTIRENIRFANLAATEQQIVEATRQANAEEFILKLPMGYDTILGERGSTLSGGQRQRLSIARAILRNPRVLVLDEPTSALDYESEKLIQEALERVSKGRTVITIAHRLSTIKTSDRIIVLKAGKIVEEGSFSKLSKNDGYFSELLSAQGMIEEEPDPTSPPILAAAK